MAFAYRLRLGFEIWVDGQLRAHSGLMGPTDGPKLLAVDGLAGAEEFRLLTRLHTDQDDHPIGVRSLVIS